MKTNTQYPLIVALTLERERVINENIIGKYANNWENEELICNIPGVYWEEENGAPGITEQMKLSAWSLYSSSAFTLWIRNS